MNNPLLIFIDAADDAMAIPLSGFLGMTVAANATVLVKFGSSIGSGGTDGASSDIVTLTITADKEKDVMLAIAQAINGQRNIDDGAIVVCDDVNSKFLHKNILSCAITLDT